MDKIHFEFERMEPLLYPSPKNIRLELYKQMCIKYKDTKIYKIKLSTEIILKTIKFKDPIKAEKILLKYKVVNLDWESTRSDKTTLFNSKMLKWEKTEEIDYE